MNCLQLVAAALAARPDHHVGLPGPQRRHQLRDVRRIVRSIGVDEHDDLVRRLLERHPQRLAFAAAVVLDDAGAVLDGDRARAIARVPVHHQYFVAVGLHRVDDLADQSFFIPGRDDDGDAGVGHGVDSQLVGIGRRSGASRRVYRPLPERVKRRGRAARHSLTGPYPSVTIGAPLTC
jgi:hypothetical protein